MFAISASDLTAVCVPICATKSAAAVLVTGRCNARVKLRSYGRKSKSCRRLIQLPEPRQCRQRLLPAHLVGHYFVLAGARPIDRFETSSLPA